MFLINVVNYLDRFVAAAVSPTLKQEFHLTDSELGVLTSAFLIVYAVAGLPLGSLSDRVSRSRVVAIGVGVWSIFSGATAFVGNFAGLALTRIFVGVGEASYLPAGTALLSSHFPRDMRARVMSWWGSGQIVGVALAYGVTGLLFATIRDHTIAWRWAFLITALPGMALTMLMFFVADRPATGAHEGEPDDGAEGGHATLSLRNGWSGLIDLLRPVLRIKTVLVAVALQGLYFVITTPAITYLIVYIEDPHGPFKLSAQQGSLIAGLMLVVGGLFGFLAGGLVSDWLGRRFQGSRVLIAAFALGAALPLYLITMLTRALPLFVLCGMVAIFCFNLITGPLTAAVQDATNPGLRGTAVAVVLLFSHLLGDSWAPGTVGVISDHIGGKVNIALLTIGIPAAIIGIAVAWYGARLYAREVEAAGAESAG
jgi:MFS transporter, Spinster family, sphingosine-1-phosphate transporter